MKKYLKNIDEQIEFNKGKNIFSEGSDMKLKFADETISAITDIDKINIDDERMLIDYTTDKVIDEFCRINQYYAFNSHAKIDLQNIYRDLFSSIKTGKDSIDTISKNHYQNLKQWLRKTNPFAEKIYSNTSSEIKPVACSEYSPELQIDILKINRKALVGTSFGYWMWQTRALDEIFKK